MEPNSSIPSSPAHHRPTSIYILIREASTRTYIRALPPINRSSNLKEKSYVRENQYICTLTRYNGARYTEQGFVYKQYKSHRILANYTEQKRAKKIVSGVVTYIVN